jgi:hypothetical protein
VIGHSLDAGHGGVAGRFAAVFRGPRGAVEPSVL